MFKVTSIASVPPKSAADQPALPPELLASVLAKYSRSNDGLDAILSKVDLNDPDASVARILKFVDYGHASIGGLTGSIAIAIDGVTMWLAYKLFEFAQHADGQEASTRYIPMTAASLPDWAALGFKPDDIEEINTLAQDGIDLYQAEKARLDAYAEKNPDAIRYPAGANDKAKARIRVNYGLDRARYFLPFALKTNIALVQTARAWCDTISALLSLPNPEAVLLGEKLKEELSKFAPNLVRHAKEKPGYVDYHRQVEFRATEGIPEETCRVLLAGPKGLDLSSLRLRQNRYDRCRPDICLGTVNVSWTHMAIAELRDLNRHRTGHRLSTLSWHGFYLPDEIHDIEHEAAYHGLSLEEITVAHAKHEDFIKRAQRLHDKHINDPITRPYTLFLGTQTDFAHTMQLDKFIYEAELRTGPGAHFRYAEHIRDAVKMLERCLPGQTKHINLGQAEPE